MHKVCIRCGAKNPSENLFCERCRCRDFEAVKKSKIETKTDAQKQVDRKYEYIIYGIVASIVIGLFVFKLSKNMRHSSNYSYNGENHSQIDSKQEENQRLRERKNISLHNKGVTLYCENGVKIDNTYHTVAIAGSLAFSRSASNEAVTLVSSCRP